MKNVVLKVGLATVRFLDNVLQRNESVQATFQFLSLFTRYVCKTLFLVIAF
jgi:hypothetical protein